MSYKGESRSARLYAQFLSAPIELRAFCLFATVSVFISGLSFIPGLDEIIIPVMGWSSGYFATLLFIYPIIFWKDVPSKNLRYRLGIVGLLAIYILFGLFQIPDYDREGYGNPYLTISKWRPVWTIVIPALWIIVLFSKRVTKFCSVNSTANSAV